MISIKKKLRHSAACKNITPLNSLHYCFDRGAFLSRVTGKGEDWALQNRAVPGHLERGLRGRAIPTTFVILIDSVRYRTAWRQY